MRCDRGSSVVEFALIAALLSYLLFAVLQVGFYLYAQGVVSAAAADGARYAAAADASIDSGASRAADALRAGLHGAGAGISCRAAEDVDAASGLATVTVRCSGRLRAVFVPVASALSIDAHSSALRERVRT